MRLLMLIAVAVGCDQAAPNPTQDRSQSRMVSDGESVVVEGPYSLSGKFGPFIRLSETQVYLVANESASWPDYEGRIVRVTGSLELAPATRPLSNDGGGISAEAPARLLLTTTPDDIKPIGSLP